MEAFLKSIVNHPLEVSAAGGLWFDVPAWDTDFHFGGGDVACDWVELAHGSHALQLVHPVSLHGRGEAGCLPQLHFQNEGFSAVTQRAEMMSDALYNSKRTDGKWGCYRAQRIAKVRACSESSVSNTGTLVKWRRRTPPPFAFSHMLSIALSMRGYGIVTAKPTGLTSINTAH